MADSRDLLIIACSKSKRGDSSLIRAEDLYDGPAYRVLRKNLNGSVVRPVVWVLSGKHGLIWGDSHIFPYDERLNERKDGDLHLQVGSFIAQNAKPGVFKQIYIWASGEYLDLLPKSFLTRPNIIIANGGIGLKLNALKNWCITWQMTVAQKEAQIGPIPDGATRLAKLSYKPLLYFMPDWDDYLDPHYNFEDDTFSWDKRSRQKRVVYAHELYKQSLLYDGILISLGHAFMGKGLARNWLKKGYKLGSARRHLHLGNKLLLMGDCGAFSYKRMVTPPFTTEQVAKIYQELRVDIGASIDHMPFGEVEDGGGVRPLTKKEMEKRVEATARFGREMLDLASVKKLSFEPMGAIQGMCKEDYATIAKEYVRAGYQYIALGGLVPKSDEEILEITESVVSIVRESSLTISSMPRIHLFGVLRQDILPELEKMKICSFDSGSYLRKAWLRSDKNYLSPTGDWYCAIRIPYSKDTRFRESAVSSGISLQNLESLERHCLELIRNYDGDTNDIPRILEAILEYDGYLLRTSDTGDLREKYLKTLTDAPWKQCQCSICKTLGIDVVIFRGFNRNKRRGFHNTKVFYERLEKLRR